MNIIMNNLKKVIINNNKNNNKNKLNIKIIFIYIFNLNARYIATIFFFFFLIYQVASNLNKKRTDKEPNMASSLAPL